MTTFFLNQTQWHLFPWWNSCQTFHSWRTVDEHCWKLSLKTAILNWQGWICVNIFYQFGQVKGVIVGNKVHWRILKRAEQENKARQIFWKANISYLPIRTRACVYRWVRNVCFFGKFGMLCFLVIPVLRFVFFPYCRHDVLNKVWLHFHFHQKKAIYQADIIYKQL